MNAHICIAKRTTSRRARARPQDGDARAARRRRRRSSPGRGSAPACAAAARRRRPPRRRPRRPAGPPATPEMAGRGCASAREYRMAALWRPIPLAPNRSTRCCRIGFVAAAIVDRGGQRRPVLRPAPLPRRARRRAAPGQRRAPDPVPGRRRAHRLRRGPPRPRHRLHRQGARDARPPAPTASRSPTPSRCRSKRPASSGCGATTTRTKPSPTTSSSSRSTPTVALDLVSTDVVHTWFVPDLAGKRDAVPGKHNQVVFRADEEGIYRRPARRPSPARPTRRCGPRSKSSRPRNTKPSSKARKPTSRPPRTGSSA